MAVLLRIGLVFGRRIEHACQIAAFDLHGAQGRRNLVEQGIAIRGFFTDQAGSHADGEID